MKKLKIDGIEYEAEDSISVLDVARANGVWIPSLCHSDHVSAYGACRLCLVEIARKGRNKVTASCTLPVSDGLEIVTVSDRLNSMRKTVMELILAHSPGSKAVQDMAGKLGVVHGRFEANPDNDCILCGLCVRACREISKAEAISFAGRGVERKVTTPFGQVNAQCIRCGACVFVCPTGSRLLNLAKISGETPEALLSKFDAEMVRTGAISRPFPQAVPNVPVINREVCLKLNRDACGICEKVCKAKAILYADADKTNDVRVGAIITAPGFESFTPYPKYEFGYSRFPDVVTSMEFERILCASGPYSGHVQRPSDGRPPKRIAFLQCVGSRDVSCRNSYCSAVCCMYAIKEAIIAREHLPQVEATVFYMDIRAYGKDFDRYFERAKSEYKVQFERARVHAVDQDSGGSRLMVSYAPENGGVKQAAFDMVVLSIGLEPGADMAELARRLGVKVNEFGFISTDSITPLRTSRPGIFVAGVASGPKDIPETVMQASGAASEAGCLLAGARGTLTREEHFPPEQDVSGLPPRIGVIVCHCGINIAGVVDVARVAEYARTLPDVVVAEDNLYSCSQDSQVHIRDLIKEHQLNRVVVASCSPRTHEPLFQATLRESGLNPYLFEMANIRDQCSWIHMDQPVEATEKACDLVRIAVAKVRMSEALQPMSMDVTQKALVVGGGLAGMTCALDIAEQGFEVFLVEKTKALGGNMLALDRTLEDNRPVKLAAEMAARVRHHPRINLFLNSRVSATEGFLGNYETTIETGKPGSGRKHKVKHGAVVLAAGASEGHPAEYGYGKSDRVMTQLELERRLASETAAMPKTVVMIQCVGSREEGHLYCSRVCCSTAVKNAIRIKQANPSTAVYVLFRDIRTYGFRESYYTQARDLGVQFIRFDPTAKPAVTVRKTIAVTVKDTVADTEIVIPADWLVLSTRVEANPDNADLSQLFKVPLNSDKFLLEAHVKLRPVDFATEGVFMAGMAHAPKAMDETIVQAHAAAARACTIISKTKFEAEPIIAAVNEDLCDGCALCAPVCDYGALEIVTVMRDGKEKKQVRVKEALCKGCGGCAATCPCGAMEQKGFKSRQILAMIDAALE